MNQGHAGQTSRRNTKEEILNACIDLFSENGFSAVSIRDIARQVGVNESSLYNHFANKDGILEAIIDKFRFEFGSAFVIDANEIESQLVGTDPEVFLQHHIMNARERMAPDILKIWKIIYMEAFRNQRIRDYYLKEVLGASAAYYDQVFAIMEKKNLIQPLNTKILSDEFNYTMVGLFIETLLLQTDKEDLAENAKRIFAHIHFFCDAITN